MIDHLVLVWQFLQAQSPAVAVRLVSWHLLAVLVGLGVLAAFGLHFLLGHVLRFYRRKDRHARWVAWPTGLVLLVSVQVLLGAYLLAVEAPHLVRRNLTGEVTARLGRVLLDPAFASPVLAAHPEDQVPKSALKEALRGSSELEYRERLRSQFASPEALAGGGGDGALTSAGPRALVQIGLRWVTAPQNVWFAPVRAGGPDAAGGEDAAGAGSDEPFFLPDFLASLVDELGEGTVLARLDWEHVAGTRFVEGVLRPLVQEYLAYLALALALIVLLLDALYFLLMRRLKRIGQPRSAKAGGKSTAKAPAKGGAQPPAKAPARPTPPAAAPGSAPDTTPAKAGAPAHQAAGKSADSAPGTAAEPAAEAAAADTTPTPTTPGSDTPAPAGDDKPRDASGDKPAG